MINEFNKDRYYIERKFHNPEEEFDPFSRMQYHGEGYDSETGLDDEGLLEGLKKIEKEYDGLSHHIIKARAIEYVLENERLYDCHHDYFIGLYSLNRLSASVTQNKWKSESESLRDKNLLKYSQDLNESGAVGIWTDYDHVVPDWDSIMKLGFAGLIKRAQKYKKQHIEDNTLTEEMGAFFEGIEIEYSAIIELINRMIAYFSKVKNEKSQRIVKCLENLSVGAPTDIYEAMQIIYIYFIVSESIDCFQVRSLGNGLDHTLYPFYENDLKCEKYTRDEIKELLKYFMMQWSAIGNYWGQPFYLGGTNMDGSTRYNDLSRDILDSYFEMSIYNPKIQLKINVNTPEDILRRAYTMIKDENASLVFCCEPGMQKAVMTYGASFDEAYDFDIRGCYETGVRGNEVCSSSGYINSAKAVEYVLTNGFDQIQNKQVGLKTGNKFETFSDFYNAFLKQWGNLIEKSFQITDDAERFLEYVNPSSMYSATIEGSLKRGIDAYQGGVKFNNNAMLCCAFATAVDSLMAVREFVYEKKLVSVEQLTLAIKENWEGFSDLRTSIRNSPHKYGNNDKLTDTYSAAMANWFSNKVNNVPNGRGGVNKAIMHSARMFIEQGKKTLATPDGRKFGEELSKNASPSMGMDKKGVTALLKSATNLRPCNFCESFCLDIVLHPSTLEGEDGYTAFKSLLLYYIKNDGISLQFNVFNADTLRDAQKNPEKYKNLQVRVCGWNVLWNNLSTDEQNAYILRAQNV